MFNKLFKKSKIKPPNEPIVWVNGGVGLCAGCGEPPGLPHYPDCDGGIWINKATYSPLKTLLEENGLTTVYCPACHANEPMDGDKLKHLSNCPFVGV